MTYDDSCYMHCCYPLLTFSTEICMLLEKRPFAGRRHASWRSDPRDLGHICIQTHVYSTPTPRRMFTHHHPVSSIYLISSHPISYHLILSIESIYLSIIYLSIYLSACVMLYLVDCDLPKLWRCMCQSLADNCCVQGAIHKNGDSEYPVAPRGDHHIFTLTFIETQGCYWQAKKGASNHADSPIPFRSSRIVHVFWRVTSLPALVLRHCNGLRQSRPVIQIETTFGEIFWSTVFGFL